MKFSPMNAQEAKAASAPEPLPEGEYDFEIISADEVNSKSSGAPMFALNLKVFTLEGKFRQVRDWIMIEGKAAWRLRQAAESLGLLMHYENGEIGASDFENTGGRCVLRIETDASGQYPPQNRVKIYLPANGARPQPGPGPSLQHGNTAAARSKERVPAGDLDDEIPF